MRKLGFLVIVFLLFSCNEVTVRLKNIPADTPSGSLIESGLLRVA